MSYLANRSRPGRSRPGPRPRVGRASLGGWFEDMLAAAGIANTSTDPAVMFAEAADAQCSTSADQQTAALDAKSYDLAHNWNPTGFYSPTEVQSLVVATLEVLRQAAAAIDNTAASAISSAQGGLAILRSQTMAKFADAAAYTAAVTSANASGGKVIDAPGLKRWVVDSMATASSGISGASYVACQKPWWLVALAAFQSAFDFLYGIAKAVVGFSIAVVEAAGGAVIKVFDLATMILKYGPYAAVIGGAWWLYSQHKAKR